MRHSVIKTWTASKSCDAIPVENRKTKIRGKFASGMEWKRFVTLCCTKTFRVCYSDTALRQAMERHLHWNGFRVKVKCKKSILLWCDFTHVGVLGTRTNSQWIIHASTRQLVPLFPFYLCACVCWTFIFLINWRKTQEKSGNKFFVKNNALADIHWIAAICIYYYTPHAAAAAVVMHSSRREPYVATQPNGIV